uniref:Ig-like domain-containing protein n=1 Tax=Oryzias latipes TaxID=8090 RepID=A0A3P9J6Z4_ORYLA
MQLESNATRPSYSEYLLFSCSVQYSLEIRSSFLGSCFLNPVLCGGDPVQVFQPSLMFFSCCTAVQSGGVLLGSSTILPCHIITNDRLSQITWQKTIKGKAPNDVFLIIQPKIGLKYRNENDLRFEFIGNVNEKNGTLKFSNVTLKDEGSYSCIFSLFPSGTPSRNSQLVVLVPPITNLMDHTPLEGNEEVPLATCTAAASKPKAEVRWIKGSLEGKVREELKETQHANGTTTTWSNLLGKPGREMNGQLVKCVISSEATKEEILETNIQVHFTHYFCYWCTLFTLFIICLAIFCLVFGHCTALWKLPV